MPTAPSVGTPRRTLMPLWNVYCCQGTYPSEVKRSFAEAVTDVYAAGGMPRFYVNVIFEDDVDIEARHPPRGVDVGDSFGERTFHLARIGSLAAVHVPQRHESPPRCSDRWCSGHG